MKVPRLRFSVRSVMLAVVICALMLWLAPLCQRWAWTWMVIRDVRRGESGRYSKQGYVIAGPRAIEALREALKSQQVKTRLSASETLSTLGRDAEGAVPELIDAALHDQDRNVRISAIGAIGLIGPGASQAVEPLLDLLRHKEDPHIILVVVEALGRIGPGARTGIPALAAMLKEPRHFAWNFAAVALCRIDPEGCAEASVAIPALIENLTKDQDPGGRRTAATFLAEMGPGARQAIPALRAATQDPAPEVRRAAVETLKVLDSAAGETGPGEPNVLRKP
jgi:HEAT repeat protein